MKLIGEEFFGLTPSRIDLWQKAADRRERDAIAASPGEVPARLWARFIWFIGRSKPKSAASLRHLEEEYKVKLKRFFAHASAPSLEALFGLFMGLVIGPGSLS